MAGWQWRRHYLQLLRGDKEASLLHNLLSNDRLLDHVFTVSL